MDLRFSKRENVWWPMVMFANVLDLATVAARSVWAIKFESESLARKMHSVLSSIASVKA